MPAIIPAPRAHGAAAARGAAPRGAPVATPTTLATIVALLFGGIAALAGIGVVVYRETQRTRAFDRRLDMPRRVALAVGVESKRRGRRSGGVRAFARALSHGASLLVPVGAAEREKLTGLLHTAGFAHRDALSVFLSVKFAVALAAGASAGYLTAGLALADQYGAFVAIFAALSGFVIGGVVPEYGLRMRLARRTRRMEAALPDAFDLMVMSLESGLTFERTLTIVAEELQPIEPNLANELRLVEAELRVSADRRAVLQNYLERSRVEGLRDLSVTLIQSERFGTPLAQATKNIATQQRTDRAARIEAQAQRLPVLMTLPMLLFVVPGTMCLVAGPAFLTAIQALGRLGGQ